jgi:hypothetical protein
MSGFDGHQIIDGVDPECENVNWTAEDVGMSSASCSYDAILRKSSGREGLVAGLDSILGILRK